MEFGTTTRKCRSRGLVPRHETSFRPFRPAAWSPSRPPARGFTLGRCPGSFLDLRFARLAYALSTGRSPAERSPGDAIGVGPAQRAPNASGADHAAGRSPATDQLGHFGLRIAVQPLRCCSLQSTSRLTSVSGSAASTRVISTRKVLILAANFIDLVVHGLLEQK